VGEHVSQSSLLAWYAESKRDLPWRHTRDSWMILLSEILLQQTQVSRGIGYWLKLVERFPTPSSMANSDVEEVLHLWQGAGYYSRARRLHALAVVVCTSREAGGFDGQLPQSSSELRTLPGVGPYTAAAVASIAHGEPIACVDGNIRRVMARQSALRNPSPSEVDKWAHSILFGDDAGSWNQALMELGATVCTPKRPQCTQCPVSSSCQGRENALHYPMPKKIKKKRMDLQCALLLDSDGLPHLVQRGKNGILAGMWGPVMAETIDKTNLYPLGQIKHSLSHRDIFVEVWTGSCKRGIEPSSVPLSNLDYKILALGGL